MNNDSTYFIPSAADSVVGLNDTVLCERELKCESVSTENGNGNSFFSTDLFANLVSAGALLITLVIFIFQTRQARKEQRRTINENWYLTIILQPQMEELDKFYKDEAKLLETQISRLKGNHGKETIEKAKSIKKLRDLKNDFFNHFILMVQGYDVNIAQEAENILNELTDLNTESIDHYDSVDIVDKKRLVFENKAKLINSLYKGISKTSASTWWGRLFHRHRKTSEKDL